MSHLPPLAALSPLSAAAHGVFRGATAVERGVARNQLGALASAGVIERVLPDVYRMTAVPPSREQRLVAALSGPGRLRLRTDKVIVHRGDRRALMRRLLVANGLTDFVREFPLELHDDPADVEHDNEKWSVPGRHGYRVVFATWDKVIRDPDRLLKELTATLAACR